MHNRMEFSLSQSVAGFIGTHDGMLFHANTKGCIVKTFIWILLIHLFHFHVCLWNAKIKLSLKMNMKSADVLILIVRTWIYRVHSYNARFIWSTGKFTSHDWVSGSKGISPGYSPSLIWKSNYNWLSHLYWINLSLKGHLSLQSAVTVNNVIYYRLLLQLVKYSFSQKCALNEFVMIISQSYFYI